MSVALAFAFVGAGIVLGGFGVFVWIVGVFSKDFWKF